MAITTKKLRFEALSQPELLDKDTEPRVQIDIDSEQATLTISDSGIGMTREEVITNLGTIAKSGTAQFLDALTGDEKKDSQLIGQFGVGFYSAFIVADEVEVLSRKAGTPKSEATLWKSKGEADYTVEPAEREQPGTTITLHLKKDEKEFAENFRIRSIVKKYADHISIPVYMEVQDFSAGDVPCGLPMLRSGGPGDGVVWVVRGWLLLPRLKVAGGLVAPRGAGMARGVTVSSVICAFIWMPLPP